MILMLIRRRPNYRRSRLQETIGIFYRSHLAMDELPPADRLWFLSSKSMILWGFRTGPMTPFGQESREKTSLRQVIMTMLSFGQVLDFFVSAYFAGKFCRYSLSIDDSL